MTTRSVTFDLNGLRWTGLAMLTAGAFWPLLPAGSGIPCPLRTLTGIPCPLCGMTTSVVATEHGHLATATLANPFGLVAVATAVFLLMRPKLSTTRLPLVPLLLLALTSWIFQLHRFHFI